MRSVLATTALLVLGVFAAAPAPVAADAPPLPPWLRPGLRLTWYVGSASIPGSRQGLVPDDKGDWVDPVTGQKYGEQEFPSTGGAGYLQLTVAAADPRTVAADSRMFLLMDPAAGRVTASTLGAVFGNGDALGEYWVHPARLAALPDSTGGGTIVRRVKYPLRGRVYNAIVSQTTSGAATYRNTFDLDSGLLLVQSTATPLKAQIVANPNGTSSMGAQGTTITSTILVDARALGVPWREGPRPEWIANGTRLEYQGTYTISVPGAPSFPQAYAAALAFGVPGAGWAPAKMWTRLGSIVPGGAPMDGECERAIGSAMTTPLWISPAALRDLPAGRVVDEDPVTRFRTTFAGVQGASAVLVEEGPFDRLQYVYDLASGLCTAIVSQNRNGVGTTTIEVRLVSPR